MKVELSLGETLTINTERGRIIIYTSYPHKVHVVTGFNPEETECKIQEVEDNFMLPKALNSSVEICLDSK